MRKRKEKKKGRKRKEKKGTKRKEFVERKGRKRRKKEREKEDFRISGGRRSTVRGLKLVHGAGSTCGRQKVGVSTNSKR